MSHDNRRALISAIAAATVATLTVGGVTAVEAATTPKPVKACADQSQNLKLKGKTGCAAGTHGVTLGQLGPRGPQGIQGVQGNPGTNATVNGVPAGGALNGTYPSPGLADGAVTATKLGTISIVAKSAASPQATGSVGQYTVFCPAGARAISGGGRTDFNVPASTALLSSRPTVATDTAAVTTGSVPDGWKISVWNNSGSNISPDVFVICLS